MEGKMKRVPSSVKGRDRDRHQSCSATPSQKEPWKNLEGSSKKMPTYTSQRKRSGEIPREGAKSSSKGNEGTKGNKTREGEKTGDKEMLQIEWDPTFGEGMTERESEEINRKKRTLKPEKTRENYLERDHGPCQRIETVRPSQSKVGREKK